MGSEGTAQQKGCNIWHQLLESTLFCQSNWPKPPGPCLLSGWSQNRESDSKCLEKPQESWRRVGKMGRGCVFRSTLWKAYLGNSVCVFRRHCCLSSEALSRLFLVLCFFPFLLRIIRGFAIDISSEQGRKLKMLFLLFFAFTWPCCFEI